MDTSKNFKAIGVIPARLGSTRLAEKVLRPIHGRPMIQHVWERAHQAQNLSDLIVACDDKRIFDCVAAFGGRAVLTRPDHPNGSSRVAEIAAGLEADIFLNIQGDEPMMHPAGIDDLVDAMRAHPEISVGTLAVRRSLDADYENPNVVKVVSDAKGNALYFSRSPLPYYREKLASHCEEAKPTKQSREIASLPPVARNDVRRTYLKHLGIYAYRRNFLLQFVTWPIGYLEDREKLEQLRILERGVAIRLVETAYDSWSVDTMEDLQLVEAKLKA